MYELRTHHQYTCDIPKCGTVVTYDGQRHTREQADRKVVRECGFRIAIIAGRTVHLCEEHADMTLQEASGRIVRSAAHDETGHLRAASA